MKVISGMILFVLAGSATGAESLRTEPNSKTEQFVADDIQIQALPNGEKVVRLISKEQKTVKQFWRASEEVQIGNGNTQTKRSSHTVG